MDMCGTRRWFVAVFLTAVLSLSGCALTIPADPDGTLDSVRNDILHVGITPNGSLTQVDGDSYSGSEVDLVEQFAQSLDASIEWTVGSEEALVRGLENSTVDLVIGGITDATPWIDKAGVTRPYREAQIDDGSTVKLVMLVPQGENAFITELETFLTENGGQAQ